MEQDQQRYIREHTTPFDPASPIGETLRFIRRESHLRTHYPQMLSGEVQGRLLAMLVRLTGARRILELGTFTGYSSLCLASALPAEGGRVDTVDCNDELSDLIEEAIVRSGLRDRIYFHCCDALTYLAGPAIAQAPYDLVFIDADKREYPAYLEALVPLLRPGGLLLADDTLWDGKPYAEPVPLDRQTQGICRFNDLVRQDPRLESVILPIRHGLSLVRRCFSEEESLHL